MITKVYMVQRSEYNWYIVTEDGNVLREDIRISKHEAENYVKNYISSFLSWTYEIVALKEKV